MIIVSINISFTMRPKKKWFSKPQLNFDQAVRTLEELKAEHGYLMDVQNDYIRIEFCPEGYFWIHKDTENGQLSGECQTNVAGAGFHAACVKLLEALAEKEKLELKVEDETEYFEHHDFDRMREEHFYPWLKSILNLICEKYAGTDFRICWPMDFYSPQTVEKTVVMPIRRFSVNEIKLFYNGKIRDFAREFFVWNEQERDAYFYRNSALNLMSTKCYFMPSSRSEEDRKINDSCIGLLEKGLSMRRNLAIPRNDYLELCRLAEREPADTSLAYEMEHECEIGYRKQVVHHPVGQFTLPVPGKYLEEYDADTHTMLYYDGEEDNWHNIRVTSYSYTQDANLEFFSTLFQNEDVEEVLDFSVGDGKCRLALYKPVTGEGGEEDIYYEMTGQMLLGNQMLLVSVTYQNEDEKDEIVKWYQEISGKEKTEPKEQVMEYHAQDGDDR